MTRFKIVLAALCLAPTLALSQAATPPLEGRLKKIHDTKTIAVAYRTDALPFSFEDRDRKPAGYTVDLCRSVIGLIERQIGVSPLQVNWVPVTGQNRFTAVASGQASRREFEAKGKSITWAISIINGLRGSLNLEEGGDIARNLDDLYDYMVRRLLDANAASDAATLQEVAGLLGEVKSGWDAIPPDLHHGPSVRQAAAG